MVDCRKDIDEQFTKHKIVCKNTNIKQIFNI